MGEPRIGVIGNGFVGGAVAAGFSGWNEVRVFDSLREKSPHSWAEAVACDVIFLCLPTPMDEGGECDTRVVEEVCERLKAEHSCHDKPIVLKSTVPPGTTDRLARENRLLGLYHSPEFLTARTARVDFVTPSRVIFGRNNMNMTGHDRAHRTLLGLFEKRFPGVPLLWMHARESELVKYACNTFFATKISFFNELRQVAGALDCDWESVMRGVLSDGRIAHSHTQVPGMPSGEPGFGGNCFLKDTAAYLQFAAAAGVDPKVVAGAVAKNDEVRDGFDRDGDERVCDVGARG